jgi:hypothetical protein
MRKECVDERADVSGQNGLEGNQKALEIFEIGKHFIERFQGNRDQNEEAQYHGK